MNRREAIRTLLGKLVNLLSLEPVDGLNDQEYDQRDDQENDDIVQENADFDHRQSLEFCFCQL